MKTKARPVIAIIIPLGELSTTISPLMLHHRRLRHVKFVPHVGNEGSPKPRKLRPASVVIAAGTDMAILANAYGE